jgi:hypothetical protein
MSKTLFAEPFGQRLLGISTALLPFYVMVQKVPYQILLEKIS